MQDDEVLSDWHKTQNGEISFKTFADKWMPYIKMDLEQVVDLGERARVTADLAYLNMRNSFVSGPDIPFSEESKGVSENVEKSNGRRG